MTPAQIYHAANVAQGRTGKHDAEVAIVVPGKWPPNDRKRLAGRKGPLGQCMADYEDAVLCLFKADELKTWAEPLMTPR